MPTKIRISRRSNKIIIFLNLPKPYPLPIPLAILATPQPGSVPGKWKKNVSSLFITGVYSHPCMVHTGQIWQTTLDMPDDGKAICYNMLQHILQRFMVNSMWTDNKHAINTKQATPLSLFVPCTPEKRASCPGVITVGRRCSMRATWRRLMGFWALWPVMRQMFSFINVKIKTTH